MRRQFDPAHAFGAGRGIRLAGPALLALGLWQGCAEAPPPRETSPQPPLVVVAVDGLDWDVLLPLVRAGELPHLAALMREGAWGALETFQPTLSPVVWTTIATGKPPREHGIEGFTLLEDGLQRLYRSDDRRTKALWNIADDWGKRCAVLGWWASWPAETFEGVCVTQRSELAGELAKGGVLSALPGQCAPPAFEERLGAVVAETDAALPALADELFGPGREGLEPLEARLLEHCLWSVRADRTYARLAEDLLRSGERFDLVAVYLGSPDVVAHRAWRYREPQAFADPPGPDAVARCGDWIDRNARWIDAWIGRLRAAAGPAANLVLLSDHGMHAANTERTYAAGAPIETLTSGHHLDAPDGVIVAAGPSVVRSTGAAGQALEGPAPRLADVYDVLPTLLAWLDVPAGRDMRGAVADGLVSLAHLRAFPARRIDTHEDAAWEHERARRRRAARALERSLSDEGRLRQLSDLGYLGLEPQAGPDDDAGADAGGDGG